MYYLTEEGKRFVRTIQPRKLYKIQRSVGDLEGAEKTYGQIPVRQTRQIARSKQLVKTIEDPQTTDRRFVSALRQVAHSGRGKVWKPHEEN
jgi:hypothetical protein